jgi:hypothetical protein
MPSFRLFLLVAFLAAIVLAVPAPLRKKNIQKRTFRVPRQLNKAHPTGPNGAAAMRKIFRKYNFKVKEDFMVKEGFISQSKQSEQQNTTSDAAGGKNTTGSVAANPGPNAALFLSPVDVGGQMLNLDFDSGSSDL